MLKQIKLWSVIALIFFACNDNEQELQLTNQETELLNTIAEESTNMFGSSFADLNEVFASYSVRELKTFDTEDFSKSSVLSYSKQSEFLSTHYEAIESVVNADNFSPTAKVSYEPAFNEEEQQYMDALTEAFALLPDREAFKEEVREIEAEISSTIADEESRLKLLAISTSGLASVNYLFDNSEEIFAQFQAHAERLNGEYNSGHSNGRIACDPPNSPECQGGGGSSGGGSCCFQGDFEWDWVGFGGEVLKGATGGAAGAFFVNVVPGAGQAAYGTAIAGGAVVGGITYAIGQTWNWMWSEPSSGGGGQSCSGLIGDPCNAQ